MSRSLALPAAALVVAAGCGGGGFALAPGDCVRTPDEGPGPDGMAEVTIVDCDEPHHLEVFHVFEPAPDEVEGAALVDAVREACLGEAFTAYVGVPEDRSELEVLPIPPTPAQLQRGERQVVCALREPGGGTRTGALRADADAAASVGGSSGRSS